MTEEKQTITSRSTSAVSRREVLKGGLIAGSAAFLAACGASTHQLVPERGRHDGPASAASGQRAGQRGSIGGAGRATPA